MIFTVCCQCNLDLNFRIFQFDLIHCTDNERVDILVLFEELLPYVDACCYLSGHTSIIVFRAR